MKCKTLHKNLIFFIEGNLPEMEMQNLQNHISECPDCADFAEDMRKTLAIIHSENFPVVNPFFYTRLKTRMETQANPERFSVWQPILVKVVQPVFFSLLLIAGIYGGFRIGNPAGFNNTSGEYRNIELLPYLNEMRSEPIENFLME